MRGGKKEGTRCIFLTEPRRTSSVFFSFNFCRWNVKKFLLRRKSFESTMSLVSIPPIALPSPYSTLFVQTLIIHLVLLNSFYYYLHPFYNLHPQYNYYHWCQLRIETCIATHFLLAHNNSDDCWVAHIKKYRKLLLECETRIMEKNLTWHSFLPTSKTKSVGRQSWQSDGNHK